MQLKKNNLNQVLDRVYQNFESADLFYGHGTDNPWDEAVALILMALDLPPDADLESIQEKPIDAKSLDLIDQWARMRIKTRKPLPYITQKTFFANLPFFVDERVIVPKSPLAEWIQNLGRPWVDPEDVQHILDLCTGSACIAIACAH